jgi:predicted nucleotidyltransferase
VDPKQARPAEWPHLDVAELLRQLTAGGVDFVIIGGIAMVLLGSARLTRDLDIFFAPDEGNLEALGRVLIALDARLREVDEDVPFVPDAATLRSIQLLTLETTYGWLDVHRSVDGAPKYEALRRRAERVDLGDFFVLVASPEDLAEMKSAAGRAQDLADIEELEAIKRLRGRARRPSDV